MKRIALAAMLISSCPVAFGQQVMSLNDAVKQGLENGYAVRLSKNELQVAANNNTYGNAGFLPKVDATAGVSSKSMRDTYTNHDGTKQSSSPGTVNANAGVSLAWTLFDGMSMFVEKERLNELQKLGDISLRVSMENLTADIISGYNAIVQQKKLIGVYEEVMSVSKRRATIAQKARSIGAGSEVALLKAQVDYKSDSANLIQQKLNLSNLKAELNSMLGRDPNTAFDVETADMAVGELNIQELSAKALEQNASLVAARQQQAISELDVKNARSAQLPYLTLNSSYTYNSNRYQNGTYDKYNTYGPYVGVTAGISLFNGFNVRRNIRNAQLSMENARISTEQQEQQLRTSLTKAYNSFTTNRSLVDIERNSLELAHRNLEIALKAYEQGSISDIDMRDTQRNFTDVSYRLLNAEIVLKNSEVELKRISGTLILK